MKAKAQNLTVLNYASEPRAELRDLGYTEYWSVEEKHESSVRMVSYFNNGAAKSVLLVETLPYGADRCSWDLFGALTTSNKVGDTLSALQEFTKPA